MAQLKCLALLVVFSLCFTGTLSTWWNPFEWRVYWIDWADQTHKETISHGEETSVEIQPTQALQKDGINVCPVKIPISVSRDCRTIPGRRRLRCRFKRYYVTNYACCPGFARVKGKTGCPKELYVTKLNIIDVAKTLGLNQFVRLSTLAGVGSELILDTKYTAFIPSNEAFEAIPKDKMDALLKDTTKLGEELLYHVVPGKLILEQLKNNQFMKTMDAPKKLRMNVGEKKQVVVVQGGKIIKANQGASNGIVHVIDTVVQPSTGSLKDYLKSNPKLSMLNRLLRDVDIDISNVTLFAPSDEAFESLPPDRLKRLLSNKECLMKVLKYHVLDTPMYSQLLESARHATVNGQFIDVSTKNNGSKLIVNEDVEITARDITTDDAIVHVIDKVLLPIGAMELIEAVKALNLTQLASMLEKSSLMKELYKSDAPFTLFAPTNDAFDALPEKIKNEINSDPKKLDKLLKYHVIDRKVWTYEFGRDTFTKSRDGMRLRLNTFQFGKVPAVNGACIKRANIDTCSGVIHVINKVLIVPHDTVYDALQNDPQFSTLMRVIDYTDLIPFLTNINGSVTFFAPTNRAFERLRRRAPSTLGLLRQDPKEARQFILAHLVNKTIYSCGLECKYSYWSLFGSRFSVFSMSRDILRLKSRWNGNVYVNGINVNPMDVSASNGVVHGINKVIDWSPLALQTRWGRRRTRPHAYNDFLDWFFKP